MKKSRFLYLMNYQLNDLNSMTKYQQITAIFNKWIGKQVDFDKVYWSQCVDWARQFAKEIWEPINTFGGSAYSGWSSGKPFTGTKWKRINRTPWLVPTAWDIIFFWPTQSNPYGHVAVTNGASTTEKLNIVEQNAWNANWDWKWSNAIKKSSVGYDARGKCLWWFTLEK